MKARTKYPISEIFGPTIQGEGPLIGQPTKFVRFAGCEFNCAWCDTQYAIEPGKPGWKKEDLSAREILKRLQSLGGTQVSLVTISGGNPALFVDKPLLDALGEYYAVALECQGTFLDGWETWIDHDALEHLVISPKPPSSKMEGRNRPDLIKQVLSARDAEKTTALKYPVLDEKDLVWAARFHGTHFPMGHRPYLSVVTLPTDTPLDILERTRQIITSAQQIEAVANWIVLPQLHALLWPHERGK